MFDVGPTRNVIVTLCVLVLVSTEAQVSSWPWACGWYALPVKRMKVTKHLASTWLLAMCENKFLATLRFVLEPTWLECFLRPASANQNVMLLQLRLAHGYKG